MKASTPKDRIELAELSKLIGKRKVADIRKDNIERIGHALKNGGSLKGVNKKLGIGKHQMYALSDKEGIGTTNMVKIDKVAEAFYRDLYRSRDNQDKNGRGRGPEEFEIPPVTTEELKKALEGMKRCKAPGEGQVTADLLKDGGQIVLRSYKRRTAGTLFMEYSLVPYATPFPRFAIFLKP